jgi:hypothetical protein
MSRLFVLTFRGTERFREDTDGHDPHESPWVMTAAAGGAGRALGVGGILDLPWIHHDSLSGLLAPASGHPGGGTPARWPSGSSRLVDVAVAVFGILAAFSIWRNITESAALRVVVLRARLALGRLLRRHDRSPAHRRPRQFGDDVIEPKVIDGAVTGVAVSVRAAPRVCARSSRASCASTHWRRCSARGHHRLSRREGGLDALLDLWLTLLIVVPLVGALGGDADAQDRRVGLRVAVVTASVEMVLSLVSRCSTTITSPAPRPSTSPAPRALGAFRAGLRRGARRHLAC